VAPFHLPVLRPSKFCIIESLPIASPGCVTPILQKLHTNATAYIVPYRKIYRLPASEMTHWDACGFKLSLTCSHTVLTVMFKNDEYRN